MPIKLDNIYQHRRVKSVKARIEAPRVCLVPSALLLSTGSSLFSSELNLKGDNEYNVFRTVPPIGLSEVGCDLSSPATRDL
jgi:hypothetical protein